MITEADQIRKCTAAKRQMSSSKEKIQGLTDLVCLSSIELSIESSWRWML